jgi:hypothetical protein
MTTVQIVAGQAGVVAIGLAVTTVSVIFGITPSRARGLLLGALILLGVIIAAITGDIHGIGY